MSSETLRLLTRFEDLGATVLDAEPVRDLEPGEGRLKLDRYALTTNNITYAAYGDAIGYWKVFPTGRPGLGAMPVWGFADIVESKAEGVVEGARVWGYFPMAEELIVTPGRTTPRGFMDAAEHRKSVPGVYSYYSICSADPWYRAELEGCAGVYRPLFITSYTAAEFLRDNAVFGAKQVVISSASSKTAYGVAWSLTREDLPLIGVTGDRNRAFVEAMGCYSRVCGYDEIATLDATVPTLYVDLAGDAGLRERVHRHFEGTLVHDCLIGSTQSDDFTHDADLPGPKARFFFAAEVLDRHRDQNTLRAFLDRFERDQLAFFERAVDPSSPWIELVEQTGFEAAASVVRELADGRSDPRLGHVLRTPQRR